MKCSPILHKNVDASRIRGKQVVGQADIELQAQLGRGAGHAHHGAAVGVEAIAAQVERMEYELEVGCVARLLFERAAVHERIEARQVPLLVVGHQVAARAVQIGLELDVHLEVAVHGAQAGHVSERYVRLLDHLHREVAAQRVHAADGDGGQWRALLVQVADGGGDLVLAVLDDGVLDEQDAYQGVRQQQHDPHQRDEKERRAHDVRNAVDLKRFQVFAYFFASKT